MNPRTLFCGVVTLLTLMSTGCCCHRRCCIPCCPTSCCSCYQPASYTTPATFAPMAAKDLPPIKLASDSTRE